ncbi:hypothetical protein [Bacteroides nordii]|jgi:hypothetical protein|uniref:hypothetical protein n=1 Tax=Bacteroides nordii TaxID=291645 RepID=UPI00189C96C9|nr:hypothetical protein [Bacteroides nordii]
MKNEEKNRKQQLTSLPISINILKVALVVAGMYYFGVKFLFVLFLWWIIRHILRLVFVSLKILFWGVIALFILYAII